MFRFPTSFLLGPCKAVGVQTKLYVKTTAGKSKWRRKSAGPGWRERIGSLGSREVWLLAFHHKKKNLLLLFFFQLRYSLKTSTCKFVNLSIISYALPEGSAPVPFHPRGTPWDSSTIEDQDYFPSESLYVWKRKGEFC